MLSLDAQFYNLYMNFLCFVYMSSCWKTSQPSCQERKWEIACNYLHYKNIRSEPVFIKPLRITLKNTAKNWLKWKKIIGSKLRLKVSYQSSQS